MPFDLTPEEIQTIGDALSLYAVNLVNRETRVRYAPEFGLGEPDFELADKLARRALSVDDLGSRFYRELPEDYENPNIEAS